MGVGVGVGVGVEGETVQQVGHRGGVFRSVTEQAQGSQAEEEGSMYYTFISVSPPERRSHE